MVAPSQYCDSIVITIIVSLILCAHVDVDFADQLDIFVSCVHPSVWEVFFFTLSSSRFGRSSTIISCTRLLLLLLQYCMWASTGLDGGLGRFSPGMLLLQVTSSLRSPLPCKLEYTVPGSGQDSSTPDGCGTFYQ
jgi:hypothetical protein